MTLSPFPSCIPGIRSVMACHPLRCAPRQHAMSGWCHEPTSFRLGAKQRAVCQTQSGHLNCKRTTMDPPTQISDEQLEDIVLRGKVTALLCRLHERAPPLVIFSFFSCRLLSSLASWQRKIREHLARSLIRLHCSSNGSADTRQHLSKP